MLKNKITSRKATRWFTSIVCGLTTMATALTLTNISTTADAAVRYHTVAHVGHIPPHVKYQRSVAKAKLDASWQRKENMVLRVAKSKLGTPYRWGHNEDRGQYGFDCSNYVEYVYHHALGYKFSGSSKVQARRVGWRVSKKYMRPGDLLIFEHGKHVGIYIGHNKMIQEGGGAGKVAIMKIGKGWYWHNKITSVKRMF